MAAATSNGTRSTESAGPEAPTHVDVLIVGAGLSGIGAARTLQARCPWATFAVLEGREAIGGTWDLFRYPGIRSDSDMFTLGYSFRPWRGRQSIADGGSILRYIRETAAETGVDGHIRFGHRVVSAEWSSDEARWMVTAERAADGVRVAFTCSFLFSATGYYRYDHGYEPEFAGVADFRGTMVHPQFWPEDLDVAGKRVVVIGSGATAITLVPSLAKLGAHVTMLQRSPTYVLSLPGADPVANAINRALPPRAAGAVVRWMKALTTQAFFNLSRRRPELVKRILRKQVERQLPPGYDVDTHFTPHYNPWDQRVCVVPDGDLFRAIREGSVDVVTDHIERFTTTGLELTSGATLDAEIVVTATGLELLFLGGMELRVDGEPVDVPTRLVYKGMMLEGVPNLAFAIGYTNASWTLKCDLICWYATELLNHLRDTGMRQATPVNAEAGIAHESLLGLTSGYVQRAADRFPAQGSAYPWRVYQSYLKDYRAMRSRGIMDAAMQFTNPLPRPAAGRGALRGDAPADGVATGPVGTERSRDAGEPSELAGRH